jgi:hypothetical protein
MKKIFICAFAIGVIAFGGLSASAQCDRNTASPIRCGFYDEGFQDGVADANAYRSNDYRRYRNKFVSLYESFYSQGYNAGYDSVRPSIRWTNSQRSAYDSGYTIGQNDRRNSGQNRSAEGAVGLYDQAIGLYFQQGYTDGFNNRPRQYDVPLNNNPTYPTYPGGGANGTASWSGRVDDRANIIIHGGTIRSEDVSGTGLQVGYQNINGVLPRRAVTVSARKTDGRGDVRVIQQPNRSNDFTAIVQVVDSRGGSDNYRVDISWAAAANVEEPYRSGSVRWRGRVDQTANIVISGSEVQTQDAAGTGLSSVSFDINGYLARRPGVVTARKRNGRGTVTVLQQPSWDNDFTAIVQVFDPSGGADNYEIEITW